MARIRTIKPAFFRHAELFDAEQSSGLPLRVAFAGLWTAADREGRFAWTPRTLKLDCLPYDDVDFGKVLEVLADWGFIVRYEVDGHAFGFIPSWRSHQQVNHREAPSTIPAPPKDADRPSLSTEAPEPWQGHARGEQEQEQEQEGNVDTPPTPPPPPAGPPADAGGGVSAPAGGSSREAGPDPNPKAKPAGPRRVEYPLPADLAGHHELAARWVAWQSHRRHLRQTLSPEAADEHFEMFRQWGPDRVVAAIK